MKKIFTIISFLIIANTYAQGENLFLKNGSFKNGFSGWKKKYFEQNRVVPKVEFTIENNGQDDNSSAKIRVSKVGNAKNNDSYGISLIGKFKPLKKGKRYKLTFWAKSRRIKDKVKFLLMSSKETDSDNPYAIIAWKEMEFKGNNEWQKFTTFFEANSTNGEKLDLKNVGIKFGLGKLGTIYIDNVRLHRVR